MRWEYSSLSLLMWASFVLYGLIIAGLFILIARNHNKKQSFNLSAVGLVGIHVLLLVVLGFNSSASNSSRVGFEIWVCGRQVELKASSVVSKFKSLNDARFSSDETLIVNGEESRVKLLENLESAGLSASLDKSGLNVPISRPFELKASSSGSLSWLSDSVKYSGPSGSPMLEVASGEV
ncbi:MAG: hypothetical protein QG623_456, partial [Patescibacteria group bacterium]|nr:hypothetical protein [Patescibacteria group bacterium]